MRICQRAKSCAAQQAAASSGCCASAPRHAQDWRLKDARRACVACHASHGDAQQPATWRAASGLQAPRLASETHQAGAAPSQLVPTEYQAAFEDLSALQQPMTVYSVRLETGSHAASALSDPMSAVNVLLVGQDGRAILHRISALNDPVESQQHVHDICQVVDASVGANCPVVPTVSSAASSTPSKPTEGASSATSSDISADASATPGGSGGQSLPQSNRGPSASTTGASRPQLRFQQGHVDEVSFLAPEIGPLVGLLVGTESGTWELEGVDISSSRTRHSDRFVCRAVLGGKQGHGARWLSPVPPEAFVYGSGESTVVLTKEDAKATRRAMMLSLPESQSRLLTMTVLLAVCGSSIAGVVAGTKAALPFAIGAFSGIALERLDTEALSKELRAALTEFWDGDGGHLSSSSRVSTRAAHQGSMPSRPGMASMPTSMPPTRQRPQVQGEPPMRALPPPPPPLPYGNLRGPAGNGGAGNGGGADFMSRQSRQQLWQQGMREPPVPGKPATTAMPRDVRAIAMGPKAAGRPGQGQQGRQQQDLAGGRRGTPSSPAASAGHRGSFPVASQPPASAPEDEGGNMTLPATLTAVAVLASIALQGDASGGAGYVAADVEAAAAAALAVPPVAALLQGPLSSPEAVVSEVQALVQASVAPWLQALQSPAGEQTALQVLLAALGFAANKVAKVEMLLADDEGEGGVAEQASLLMGPRDGGQLKKE